MTKAILACALVLIVGACGGGSGGSSDAKTQLDVRVWPDGMAGDSLDWTLECDPAGGNHPEPEEACAELAATPNPFGYPKKTPRCNEIPGATEDEARISGMYLGRKVHVDFDRSSGCFFERWDRLSAVFQTGF